MANFLLKIFNRFKDKLKHYNPFLISTMGRSGTWYNREFFYFYSRLLNGEKSKDIIENMIENKIKIKYLINLKNNFSYNSVFIQHFLCPGFELNYNGEYRSKWDDLYFYSNHIPGKYTKIMRKKNVINKLNPYVNKNAKIIYYLRNPFDQNVSYFSAIQNHLDKELKYYYDTSLKKKIKFLDIHDFLRKAGIDMYLKHYLSFKLLKNIFPENILILYYENMVKNPQENFLKVLNFIGHDVEKIKFDEAIKLSSKESIIKLENAYGEPISKAYQNKTDRQLKDAKIGKWKNILSEEDIGYIKMRFDEFDVDLKSFIYE